MFFFLSLSLFFLASRFRRICRNLTRPQPVPLLYDPSTCFLTGSACCRQMALGQLVTGSSVLAPAASLVLFDTVKPANTSWSGLQRRLERVSKVCGLSAHYSASFAVGLTFKRFLVAAPSPLRLRHRKRRLLCASLHLGNLASSGRGFPTMSWNQGRRPA